MNQSRDAKGRFCKKTTQTKSTKQPRASNGRFLSNKPVQIVKGFKGFSDTLSCNGMQYRVGKTHTVEGKIRCCDWGLHFCLEPVDTFWYYSPRTNCRYALVTAKGQIKRRLNSADSKCCTNTLTVDKEVDILEYCDIAIETRKSNYQGVTQLLDPGSYSIKTPYGYMQIDNTPYGYACRNDNKQVRISVTTSRGSISVADCIDGHAFAFGAVSIAKGHYAMTCEAGSVAISNGEHGIAIATNGRAITEKRSSIAISGPVACLEMHGIFSIGILRGQYAKVSGKFCTLIVTSVYTVYKLWLCNGTFVVLLDAWSKKLRRACFTAGKELKPEGDNLYTGEAIEQYFKTHAKEA